MASPDGPQLERMEALIEKVHYSIVGNGDPGLNERVRNIEHWIAKKEGLETMVVRSLTGVLVLSLAAAAGKVGLVYLRIRGGRDLPAVRTSRSIRVSKILTQFIVVVAVAVAGPGTVANAEVEQWHSDEWVFGAQAYLWGAGVETDFPDGRTSE